MNSSGLIRIVSVLLLLLAGCHKAPAYESRYTEAIPTSTLVDDPTPAPPAPPVASFLDSFDGADTESGQLGEGWDLRGQYDGVFPLPPASDGYVRGGMFTYAGASVVRAVRQFSAPVLSMGAVGRWLQVRDGGVETTMTMAVTPNANVISDMVQLSVNRSTWKLMTRRNNGGFDPIATGQFSPILNVDQNYNFELDVSNPGEVTLRLPDDQVLSRNVDITDLVGNTAFWELYPMTTPASVIFGYEKVWADEAGEPVRPVS